MSINKPKDNSCFVDGLIGTVDTYLFDGVGSLSDTCCIDKAEGDTVDVDGVPERSGTFLQAWSNAEQLRVWYQCFLGIQPDLLNGLVTVKPMLPKEISRISLRVKLGKGYLIYNYKDGKFDISLDGIDAQLQLILPKEEAHKSINIPFCKPDNLIIKIEMLNEKTPNT